MRNWVFGVALLIVACSGVVAVGMRGEGQPQVPLRSGPEQARQRALERGRQMAAIEAMIADGRVVEARATLQAALAGPLSRCDAIRVHQGLARCDRASGNPVGAATELRAALARSAAARDVLGAGGAGGAVDVDAQMAGSPAVRAGLLMELADALAFGSRDKREALVAYEEVLTLQGEGLAEHQWVAASHAAMFTADLGRPADAAVKAARALGLPEAAARPEGDRQALRLARAQWLRDAGDLRGSFDAHLALWSDGQHSANPIMISVGLQLAAWHPVSPDCTARLAVCRRVIEMLRDVAPGPTRNGLWSADDRVQALRRLETVLIESPPTCDGATLLLRQVRAELIR